MNRNRKLRLDANMTIGELALKLRPRYPRMSKAAISLAENSDATGITYTRSALKDVEAVTGHRRDNRRCPIRIQCRLTEADRDEFNVARTVMGHDTVNDAVICAIHWYIRTAKKAAAAGPGTAHDGKRKYPIPSISREGGVVNDPA